MTAAASTACPTDIDRQWAIVTARHRSDTVAGSISGKCESTGASMSIAPCDASAPTAVAVSVFDSE